MSHVHEVSFILSRLFGGRLFAAKSSRTHTIGFLAPMSPIVLECWKVQSVYVTGDRGRGDIMSFCRRRKNIAPKCASWQFIIDIDGKTIRPRDIQATGDDIAMCIVLTRCDSALCFACALHSMRFFLVWFQLRIPRTRMEMVPAPARPSCNSRYPAAIWVPNSNAGLRAPQCLSRSSPLWGPTWTVSVVIYFLFVFTFSLDSTTLKPWNEERYRCSSLCTFFGINFSSG